MYSNFYFPLLQATTPLAVCNHLLKATVLTVEISAQVFNDVLIDLSLAALESGVITRRWWESHGKDLAWSAAQATGLAIIALVCVACYLAYGVRTLWSWANDLTDDGLGLYGPSPLLQQLFTAPVAVTVDTEVEDLELPGEEVLAWARAHWPQLNVEA